MLSFSAVILLLLYTNNTEIVIFVMLVQQTVIHDFILNPMRTHTASCGTNFIPPCHPLV